MKTIGLIGGLSWVSTVDYYRIINEATNRRLGGMHSAKILMQSVDLEEALTGVDGWRTQPALMIDCAKRLESMGADCILICTNTFHKAADDVQKQVSVPLIHIADCAGAAAKDAGMKKVGLLGTRFTMGETFYRGRIKRKFGIDVVIPGEADCKFVDDVIFNELCLEKFLPQSKAGYLKIIDKLSSQGAEGIVLGCTEIPLLVKQEDTKVPLFDTTRLHALAAVDFALAD